MAEITAATVKALREATGQGMMECKKALQETGGDMDAAKDLLRKKGLVTAEKKASRATSEGLIAISINDAATQAAMVEVQCETDFCARNDVFRSMVKAVADMAAAQEADGEVGATDAISEAVQDALAKIGENMSYSRGVKMSAPRIGTYIHHNNKVGVLLGVDGEVDDETLSGLCMHVAFTDPIALTADEVPSELVEKEREIAHGQAIEAGKPPEIADKMVEGKIRKFMAENALIEQPYVRDEKQAVKEVLGSAKITGFVRFAVGA